jgi:hypothetical protein
MQKADPKEQALNPGPSSLSGEKLQEARQLLNILILGWKNYGLYPEDHVSTIKSLENLVAAFSNYFTNHGNLRLTVEKGRLLCENTVIYEVSSEAPSEDIISLLYRDGIKWIEFQPGLTLEEIASFFKIAYKYRLFAEETEGDIVTALMDEELEHIDFKAVDIFWQDQLVMDFSQLPSPVPQQQEGADQNQAADEYETDKPQQTAGLEEDGDIIARSIADPSISHTQLELSSSDYQMLQQMVQEEESWHITEDLFDVLLIILKNQIEKEKFGAVLDYTLEVTAEAIALYKFDLLIKFFQSLTKLFPPKTSNQEDWKRYLVDHFFQGLSNPEIFQLISKKLLMLPESQIGKLLALGRLLRYFSPEIIPYLIPVIMQRNSPEIQQMVLEVIEYQCQRDIGPLEKIADQHGSEMGDRLLVILDHLQGDRANNILFKMCEHSSDQVRKNAIKELLDRDPKYTQKLFSLIDDPNKEIRASILAAVAKNKSGTLENLLLHYLKGNPGPKDPGHILACYKALGRCGSNISVPFLRRTLLARGWNSFMGSGKLVFREGAAVALALIDTPIAMDVLRKASQSRFKVIREAFARTRTIPNVSGENTNA